MRVAVLGLGEAGSIYAADLPARGASVVGTDLHARIAPAGVGSPPTSRHAVRGADVVLSLVGASSAASVLDEALPAMDAASVFVDMNTSGPDDKRRLAAVAAERGIAFVDVAILAPVPRARIDTPLLLSGVGVAQLRPLLEQLRIPITDVGAEPGAAARLKLLRSVFMKGLAAGGRRERHRRGDLRRRGLAHRSDRRRAGRVGPQRRRSPARRHDEARGAARGRDARGARVPRLARCPAPDDRRHDRVAARDR